MNHTQNFEAILESNELALGLAMQADFDIESNRFTGVIEYSNYTSVDANPALNKLFNPFARDNVSNEILKSYGLVATSTCSRLEGLTISLSSERKEEFVRDAITSDIEDATKDFVRDHKDVLFSEEESNALRVIDEHGLHDEERALEQSIINQWICNEFSRDAFIETFVCDTEKFKTFVARSKDDDFESWLFDVELATYLKETHL